MNIKIPQNAKEVISAIENAGYEAYIVGGCVRDLLMGKNPHDYDVTTSATPSVIKSIFKNTADTGIKHGTVTVICDKEPIEVTTFRTEEGYLDGRHPSGVAFVSDIKEDLSRRDFTVNAMAYSDRCGLIDLWGGKEDIDKKILRAVGEPKRRFTEDGLRIMRLFRFAAVLGFEIEEKTLNYAILCRDNLKNVSSERIASEFLKSAQGSNLKCLIPLINSGALSKYSLDKKIDEFIEKAEKLPDGDIRTFALLYFTSSDITDSIKQLKLSNSIKKYCLDMLKTVNAETPKSNAEIKHYLRNYEYVFCDMLCFKSTILGEKIKDVLNLYGEIKRNREPYLIKHLDISGDDLIKKGIKGEKVGITLNFLLSEVINENVLNEKQSLLNLI